MVAEAARLNTKARSLNTGVQTEQMKKFLNFMPIIGIDGKHMKEYSVKSMLTQLKRSQAESVVRNGFDDTSIYNDELLKLTEGDLRDFEELKAIVGQTKQVKKISDVNVNNQGLTEEWEKGKKKPPRERTLEEIEAMEKRKELSKQRQTMISILRGNLNSYSTYDLWNGYRKNDKIYKNLTYVENLNEKVKEDTRIVIEEIRKIMEVQI